MAFSGSLVYVLVVVRVISTAWYVILIHMFYETIANIVIVLSMGRRGSRNQVHEMRSPRVGQIGDTATPTNDRGSKEYDRGTYVPTDIGTGYEHSGSSPAVRGKNSKEHFIIVFQSGAIEDEDDNHHAKHDENESSKEEGEKNNND